MVVGELMKFFIYLNLVLEYILLFFNQHTIFLHPKLGERQAISRGTPINNARYLITQCLGERHVLSEEC